MKIAIGSDHRGYDVKRRIVPCCSSSATKSSTSAPTATDSVDYPDFAFQVATR